MDDWMATRRTQGLRSARCVLLGCTPTRQVTSCGRELCAVRIGRHRCPFETPDLPSQKQCNLGRFRINAWDLQACSRHKRYALNRSADLL